MPLVLGIAGRPSKARPLQSRSIPHGSSDLERATPYSLKAISSTKIMSGELAGALAAGRRSYASSLDRDPTKGI
jgi:hypothetical protein